MYLLPIDDINIEIPHDPILVTYRGSHAHGTYISPEDPTGIDDVDLIGICIPPLDHYFGTKKWDGKDFWVGKYDIVLYSFSKFVNLLTKGNPNCIGILWTKSEHILVKNTLGEKLINYRNMFLGKETVVSSFKGYAANQMHKMTHFNDKSYYEELTEVREKIIEAGVEGLDHDDIPADNIELRKLVAYYNKLKKKLYAGYMGEKRKALADKYHFDVKNASHLIRLLTMCVELLDTCTINVYREHDAKTFIDIKKGKWKLEEVSELAEQLFAEIRDKYDACPLPDQPDYEMINSTTTEWLREYYLQREIDD